MEFYIVLDEHRLYFIRSKKETEIWHLVNKLTNSTGIYFELNLQIVIIPELASIFWLCEICLRTINYRSSIDQWRCKNTSSSTSSPCCHICSSRYSEIYVTTIIAAANTCDLPCSQRSAILLIRIYPYSWAPCLSIFSCGGLKGWIFTLIPTIIKAVFNIQILNIK